MNNFIEQKAITLIKEIEKRHHTPSKVIGSGSFEQELMEEKVESVKDFYQSIIDMIVMRVSSLDIPPFSADEKNPIIHVYKNSGYLKAIEDVINSLKQD